MRVSRLYILLYILVFPNRHLVCRTSLILATNFFFSVFSYFFAPMSVCLNNQINTTV
ncbi:unnamed protein product [Ectocarpus sp. 8 AP-2014]